MKKILISLSVISVVAAIAVGGTIAFFSDTETSTGNTFTAGTIDISVDNMNPWNETFALVDMKPSYTDYINFEIQNTGSDPNPVNVWKNIKVTSETTGTQSEPECTEQLGCWDNSAKACDWTSCTGRTDKNDLSSVIWYDLYVEVYSGNNLLFWQTIYADADHETIDKVYGVAGDKEVYLGMIPAGGKMKVQQSYHMDTDTGNWAQGDQMTFNINLRAEQIKGIAVLENKQGPEPWHLVLGDGIEGTLTYIVKNPTFNFTFTGKAPLFNHIYVLAAGMKSVGGNNYDVDTKLGTGTSGSDGAISFSGNVELLKDMKNVKVWLVPTENWNDSTEMVWGGGAGWPGMVTQTLWETGLIWYDDTNN